LRTERQEGAADVADEFAVRVRANGAGEVTIEVLGEIDMSNAPGLEASLREHADTDLTIDLSEVSFLR
jgi:anti-anti-sigma regulatory factor